MEIQKSREFTILTKIQVKPGLGNRLLFIDNLRWLMIVFVVIMHLNVTYSTFGSWYYVEHRHLDIFSTIIFAIYGSFTQAYFMGFLFLIAGYFVPGAYDKKGPGKFVTDRLIRLGIPTLVYMLFIDPINNLIRGSMDHVVPSNWLGLYGNYIFSFRFIGSTGPLWFAFALLIFSLIYALARRVFAKNTTANPKEKPVSINHIQVIGVIFLIAVMAFLIRLVQPIGTSFFNMQLCYFAAYIVLFILGIIAYRYNLFLNIPYRFGITWFKIALWVGIPFWVVMIIGGGAKHGMSLYNGGLYWQTAAYAFWESFFCVGVCLGLLVLFREKHNTQGKVSKFLSENAFAVYVFHAPILIWITLMVREIAIYPLLKMILVSLIVLPVCFGVSALIRKIPGVRKIFS